MIKKVLFLCLIAALVGGTIGHFIPVIISPEYSKLFSVVILAGLETVFRGFRTMVKGEFYSKQFMLTFLANLFIVVVFVFVGDRLGLDLYYVILLALGFRLLQDLDIIKAYFFKK